MNRRKIALLSGVMGLGGVAIISASALAATTGSSADSYSPLVQKIADKFHLNPADVKSVVDEQRGQNFEKRHQKLVTILDQAVKDGKITQDQENKILTHLQTLRQSSKTAARHDRKADRQKMQQQLQQWLSDNNINLDLSQPAPPPTSN